MQGRCLSIQPSRVSSIPSMLRALRAMRATRIRTRGRIIILASLLFQEFRDVDSVPDLVLV